MIVSTKIFKVNKGESVALLDFSNAEAVLLNLLNGKEPNVTIEGQDLSQMDDDQLALFRRQKTGYISRDFKYLPNLDIKQNIALPLALNGNTEKETAQTVEGIMELFGIHSLANSPIESLTEEEKQRISAARAMTTNPVICLADQPTENTMETLSILNAESGTTVLISTCDALIASFCTRVIYIKNGEFLAEVTPSGSRAEFFKEILDMQFELFSTKFAVDKPTGFSLNL